MNLDRKCYTYVLRCSDGSYYVGHTHGLKERIKAHNDGRAAGHAARRRPVSLVYSEEFAGEEEAMRRERQLKRWSRAKKEALIQGDGNRLKLLSKSRD
ncbi:MAG: GIY-YIG nuclease family protein [bacterium]